MQKKLTVVHVTSSLAMGGAETVLYNLIDKLGSDEFEHHVIYFHGGYYVQKLQLLDVQLYQIKGAFSLYDPIFFVRLLRCIKKIQPNLINSLLWAANVSSRIAGTLLRIPVISTFHNNVEQDGMTRRFFDRLTLPLATKLVAVSDGVARSVLSSDRWTPAHKMQIIHNGVDVQMIHNKKQNNTITRTAIGLTENNFIIGSVGRFHPVKNYDLLLESFALVAQQHAHVRLVLVGQGQQEQQLREQAKRLKIEDSVVFVVGKVAYDYYSLFDCFLITSDKEGISIALLEAMSCSLPCITTHTDSKHAVIDSGHNGLIVPAGDKNKIVQSLCRLITNSTLCEKLALSGYETVQKYFSLHLMVDQYRNIFRQESISRQKEGD